MSIENGGGTSISGSKYDANGQYDLQTIYNGNYAGPFSIDPHILKQNANQEIISKAQSIIIIGTGVFLLLIFRNLIRLLFLRFGHEILQGGAL